MIRKKELRVLMSYDDTNDMAYLYLGDIQNGEVTNSIPVDDCPGSVDVVLDFDRLNQLKGIEIISASNALPASWLKELREAA